MFFDYDFRNYNFRLMSYMIALNVIGVLVVRSATNKDPDFVTKQLMGVMVGLVIAICLSLIDYHKILNFSTIIYLLCICSLIAVLIWGQICQQRKTLDRSSGTWTASAFRICKNWSDYYIFPGIL